MIGLNADSTFSNATKKKLHPILSSFTGGLQVTWPATGKLPGVRPKRTAQAMYI
jgi:hypothetical protein